MYQASPWKQTENTDFSVPSLLHLDEAAFKISINFTVQSYTWSFYCQCLDSIQNPVYYTEPSVTYSAMHSS